MREKVRDKSGRRFNCEWFTETYETTSDGIWKRVQIRFESVLDDEYRIASKFILCSNFYIRMILHSRGKRAKITKTLRTIRVIRA